MKYTIYQVTNKINGKFYVGKHQTDNPYDSYYGSGRAIECAIKKYGKENFDKKVLFIFETEEEMNKKEKEIISEDFVNNPNNYNLGVGGEGGPHFKNKTHSKETRLKLSKISKAKKPLSLEARKRISEKSKGRNLRKGHPGEKNPNYGKFCITNDLTKQNSMIPIGTEIPEGWRKGRYISEEQKSKISRSVKERNIKLRVA